MNNGALFAMLLLLVVFGLLYLGKSEPGKTGEKRAKKGGSFTAGQIIEVYDANGKKHKAMLLPEEKKPERPRQSSWKYRG